MTYTDCLNTIRHNRREAAWCERRSNESLYSSAYLCREYEVDRLDPWQAYQDLAEAIRMIEPPRKPTGKVGSDDASYAWQCADAIGVALGAVAEFAERLTRSCDHAAGRKLTPRGDFALWCGKADQYLAEPLRDIARRECDERGESLRGRLVASTVNAGRR